MEIRNPFADLPQEPPAPGTMYVDLRTVPEFQGRLTIGATPDEWQYLVHELNIPVEGGRIRLDHLDRLAARLAHYRRRAIGLR